MIRGPKALLVCALLWAGAALRPAEAALQFDVFFGYEGAIHEAGWFPVLCEIHNDGPSFNAVIEIAAGGFGSRQRRRVPIELPTNTRKRVLIPMFASGSRFNSSWEARLLTPKGKVLEERVSQPKVVPSEDIILGSLARNFGGSPVFPEVNRPNRAEGPEVARMQAEQFPDNPIVLEGLDALYLHTEKALDLRVEQVTALLAWVRSGGHLIVGVDQPGDVNGTPWLRQFLPMQFTAVQNHPIDQAIIEWIESGESSASTAARRPSSAQIGGGYSSVPPDPAFKDAEMQVVTGALKDGTPVITADALPLAVQAPRGRGKVTVLTFSPEREPFRSWEHRGYFWGRITGIPAQALFSADPRGYGGTSIDGVFGALIDSRQIKKLPVTWLLLLLVVYLVVIGPLDQWWLKKINRQMLTWLTFPAYVVLFSLLIYFIGYKLRAGETEWNEFHIVDVLPRGGAQADFRGRTYISIYSSSNERYPIQGEEGYASFRTELADLYGGGRNDQDALIVQDGNSFKAEVFVPVWTSLLYANEWFQTNSLPFAASIAAAGSAYQVEVENFLNEPLRDVRLAVDGLIFKLPQIPAGQSQSLRLTRSEGQPLADFVQQNGGHFQQAVDRRRNPVGGGSSGQIDDRALTGAVVSFLSYLQPRSHRGQREFVAPPGLDITSVVERGDAVLFAFLPGFSFTEDLHQFNPRRFQRDTLVRLSFPVRRADAL